MDAVTLVAAAVAVACDQSRNAALEEVLRDRELAAMRAADLESLVAQRMFTSNAQLPSARTPMTWRAAQLHTHNDGVEQRRVMEEKRRAIRSGHARRALALLDAELSR